MSIILSPKIKNEVINYILKDYSRSNYYTNILHQLERPGAAKICVIDGRKFTLASNVDDNKRMHLSVDDNKISFFRGTVNVKLDNKSEESIGLQEHLNGLEFKTKDGWVLSPGDANDLTERGILVKAKSSTEIPFYINPRKMQKGKYRIVCLYGVDGIGVVDYVELEY